MSDTSDWHYRVETIENVTQMLDQIIVTFRRLREAVMLLDEEYAGYVEQYEAFYNDDPLPIRHYYEKTIELESITAKMFAPDAGAEEIYQENKARIIWLERALAA